jgi:hypothetical protein
VPPETRPDHTPYELPPFIGFPAGPRFPPMPLGELPPGIQPVILPGGIRTLAYTQPAAQPPPPVVRPVSPVPSWAKTTALLAPTLGGGIAAAGFGISYAAPGLATMTDMLWAAVALLATGTIAVTGIVSAARRTATTPGDERAEPVHVTQNITATGLFGRANGTINHR